MANRKKQNDNTRRVTQVCWQFSGKRIRRLFANITLAVVRCSMGILDFMEIVLLSRISEHLYLKIFE